MEKVEGETEYEGMGIMLVDTPGIYSLTCYTIEEKVTRSCVMDDDIDVIVNIVDASSLERNLYLTLQLLELGKPVVLALNIIGIFTLYDLFLVAAFHHIGSPDRMLLPYLLVILQQLNGMPSHRRMGGIMGLHHKGWIFFPAL